MQRRRLSLGSVLLTLFVGAGLVAGGITVGLMLAKKKETGEWALPNKGDFAAAKEKILAQREPVVPRIVYLRREAVELYPGRDDSRKRTSSIVRTSQLASVKMPGFSGSNSQWKRVVRCVRATFKPFNLEFTDIEPGPDAGDYILVAMGGNAMHELKRENGNHVGGLAPFSGGLIEKPIVFVFSDRLRNSLRPVCNTAAQEIAHVYGLDHLYNCQDVMTYLPDCGPKYFRNKDVPCGEYKTRTCKSGRQTQNSYQFLASVVGLAEPREAAASKP